MQTGMEKNVFGNNPVSMSSPPEHLVTKDAVGGNGSARPSSIDIVEIDAPNSANHIRSPPSGVVSTLDFKFSVTAIFPCSTCILYMLIRGSNFGPSHRIS